MADRFPNISFDWLGELPGIAEGRASRDSTKQSLADFTSDDPNELIKKGTSILHINPEMGLKLITEGRNGLAIRQRIMQDEQYQKLLPFLLRQQQGGSSAPSEPAADPIYPPTPGGPAAHGRPAAPTPPASPDPFAGAPGGAAGGNVLPGPGASLPPLSGAAAAALSPSEQLLTAAQGGLAPPSPGPQLAGPLPTGGGPAPIAPVVPDPGTVSGALARPTTTQPPGQAPAAPPEGGKYYPDSQDAEQALADSRKTAQMLLMLPKGAPASAVSALRSQFQSQLDKTRMSPEQKSYQIDRLQRIYDGRGDISLSDWKLTDKVQPEVHKDARKLYESFEVEGEKATKLSASLDLMGKIVKNPNFISGRAGSLVAHGASIVGGLWDAAQSLGLNPEQITGRKKEEIPLMKSAALIDTFQALSNQSIYAALGSLGNQISEGDRNFIVRAFPSLLNTREGTELLIDVMSAATKQAKISSNAARSYVKERGVRADPAELRDAVDKVASDRYFLVSKDGEKTALAKRIDALSEPAHLPGVGVNAPPPVPPTPPGATAKPGTIIYKNGKPYTLTPNGPVPVDGAL